MVEACEQIGIRFSINHQKRASNYNSYVKQLLPVVAFLIHAYDKRGRTAGNVMMEMGTHLFDWVGCFAGDVNWASAHLNTGMDKAVVENITYNQEISTQDRDAGLVVGGRELCSFGFINGLHADCHFRAQLQANDKAYRLELICTQGRILLCRSVATVILIHRGEFMTSIESYQWDMFSFQKKIESLGSTYQLKSPKFSKHA